MAKMKISEWLGKRMESHGIYDDANKRASFKEETGHVADWHASTVKETREMIRNDSRGGSINGADDQKVCYGYEVAEHLADKYGSDKERDYTRMFGRGSRFRGAIASIKAAGN